MTQTNLICLPYAGGNAYCYNIYRMYFNGKINMINPELPGRGKNLTQPLIKNADLVADKIFNNIYGLIQQGPYALYGHSMGGLLAWLIARRIESEKLPSPLHLFCSGRKAPSIPAKELYYNLPDDEFIAKLRDLGGSPDEILDNKEFMDFMLPIIRSDFELSQTYKYDTGKKLNIPITIFRGENETIEQSEVEAWQLETTKPVELLTLPGNHFFIFEHASEICKIMLNELVPVPMGAYC